MIKLSWLTKYTANLILQEFILLLNEFPQKDLKLENPQALIFKETEHDYYNTRRILKEILLIDQGLPKPM